MNEQLEAPTPSEIAEAELEARRASGRERVRKFRERHRQPTLEERQAAALAALPEERRAELLALHERFLFLEFLVQDTIAGITDCREAGAPLGSGREMCFPDLLFLELREFLKECPPVGQWAPKSLLPTLDEQALASLGDRNLVEYGLQTRFFGAIVSEFYRYVLTWSDVHADEVEPGVLEELRNLVKTNTPKPVVDNQPRFVSERERTATVMAAAQQKEQAKLLAAEQERFWRAKLGLRGEGDADLQVV